MSSSNTSSPPFDPFLCMLIRRGVLADDLDKAVQLVAAKLSTCAVMSEVDRDDTNEETVDNIYVNRTNGRSGISKTRT